MRTYYTKVSDDTQRQLFRVWFMNNCIQRDGQSSIQDLIGDYQNYNFAAIDKITMATFLSEYNIIVENDVVIGVRLV